VSNQPSANHRLPAPAKLALVITSLEVGGAETCLTNLALRVDRARFTPHVYSLAAAPKNTRLIDQLAAAEVPVTYLGASAAWQLPPTVSRLRARLAVDAIEIVQSFLFHANVVCGLATARRPQIPLVLGFRVAEHKRLRLLLEIWTGRRAAAAVCVSDSVREFYEAQGFRHRKLNLLTIPNGIDTGAYSAQSTTDAEAALNSLGVPSGRRVFTFVGRLEHQKGVDWLLRMAADLLGGFPSHDLLLVGDGRERAGYQRLAASLAPDVRCRIHFVGRCGDVPGILTASDLLLLPSRWEGMPNVVLEAMAAGIPVVAADTHGVRELLGPGSGAQVVTWGDDTAFIAAAQRLAAKDVSAAVGAANRARVASAFSLSSAVSRYEQLWQQVVCRTATKK